VSNYKQLWLGVAELALILGSPSDAAEYLESLTKLSAIFYALPESHQMQLQRSGNVSAR